MTINVGFAKELGICFSKITEFYKNHWTRKIMLSDDIFHRWQFENPPLNGGANSCVVAVRNEQILGVMGLNRRIFYLGTKMCIGAELTTWVVDQKTKGSGVGAKILSFITNQFEILFGMGISQDALPIYLRSGFRYMRYIPRYIYVVDAKKILRISDHAPYAFKLVKSSEYLNHSISSEKTSWGLEKLNPYVEGNHFSRNIEDLTWRYDSHPYFNYLTYKIFNKDSCIGYVVLRAEITHDIRILHVVDILGCEDSYENSIKFIENFAKTNNFWAVDMYSTFAPLNKYFNIRGWLSAVDSSFINVPHLFHPLEVRNPATTSLIYWSKNFELSFYDISNLYLTKQDCDLDRPTMDFIGL